MKLCDIPTEHYTLSKNNGAFSIMGSVTPDKNDGRGTAGEESWKSRYPGKCWIQIVIEAVYVGVMFVAGFIIVFFVVKQQKGGLGIAQEQWVRTVPMLVSLAGGWIGGCLYDMKWLYHSVARQIWNRDRILWRIFTPFLSAGASFIVVSLGVGNIIPFIAEVVKGSISGTIGLSIVIGYFSDRVFSSLQRVAENYVTN